jgi:hypothetical protein
MKIPLLNIVILSFFALGFIKVTLAQTYDEKILNQNNNRNTQSFKN